VIEAIANLHAALGIALLAMLAALAGAAAFSALSGRSWAALRTIRRVALGIVAGQVGLGLALALRGDGPAEAIHWIYGGGIVLALLAPSIVEPATRRGREAVLVVGTLLAAVFAWRLWGSG
jgi:hypothetical protein